MWRELRAWRWVIFLGVVFLWIAAGFPPFGPFQMKRSPNFGFDSSWECRSTPKGGPICWKKSMWQLKKNLSGGAKASTSRPAAVAAST